MVTIANLLVDRVTSGIQSNPPSHGHFSSYVVGGKLCVLWFILLMVVQPDFQTSYTNKDEYGNTAVIL